MHPRLLRHKAQVIVYRLSVALLVTFDGYRLRDSSKPTDLKRALTRAEKPQFFSQYLQGTKRKFLCDQVNVHRLSAALLVTFGGYRLRHFSKPTDLKRAPTRAAQPQPFYEYIQGSERKFVYGQVGGCRIHFMNMRQIAHPADFWVGHRIQFFDIFVKKLSFRWLMT